MSDGELNAFAGLLGLCGLGLLVFAVLGFDQRVFARVLDGIFGLALLGGAGYLVVRSVDIGRLYWLVLLALLPLMVLLSRERRRARRRRLAAGLIPQMYVAPPPPTPLKPFPAPPPPLGAAASEGDAEAPHRATYQPLPSGLPRKPGPSLPGLSGQAPTEPPPPDHGERGPREWADRDHAPTGWETNPAPTEWGSNAAGPSSDHRHGVASGPDAPLPGRETFRHALEPQQAGHDTAAVHETSSRLRRPAYLEQPPAPPGGGRHRASEPAAPHPAQPAPAHEQEHDPPEEWPPYHP